MSGDVPGGHDIRPASDAAFEALRLVREMIGGGHRFRFVTEARADAYVAILLGLLRRRDSHEIEVLHDVVHEDTLRLLGRGGEEGETRGYDAVRFRQDVEQLIAWGNVKDRVEPTRIRSLADRGRSKLLLRLEPDTAAFLQFLESQVDPLPLGVGDQGANLLTDIHAALREAVASLGRAKRLLRRAPGPPEPEVGEVVAYEELLLRASYLVREADDRAERVARELVEFAGLLARFTAEPFRVESLNELASWLERYLERYLTVLEERGRGIRKALSRLLGDELLPVLEAAGRVERQRLRESPGGLGRSLRVKDAVASGHGLTAFFEPARGLAQLCRRVDGRARDVVRRIQRHVEAIRLRNVRTEAIRARTRELFALESGAESDAVALDFLQELLAPVCVRTDGRAGTPDARAAPPRPARRYEARRPAFRGEPLEEKRTDPGQARDVELLRLELLSRFVEQRVLRGRAAARVAEAELEALEDGRRLVSALSAYLLRSGRARRHLRYVIDRPAGRGRARFERPEFALDLRDAPVRRKDGS